jgi:hypothetical protein
MEDVMVRRLSLFIVLLLLSGTAWAQEKTPADAASQSAQQSGSTSGAAASAQQKIVAPDKAAETSSSTTTETKKGVQTLPEVVVEERSDSMIGIADTSTQGTIGALELSERPISRPGEVLEAMPGMIVTQHSGDGKANQYFLRGFNLDHGTDMAAFFNGIPVNLPSNAHGEGYTDLNFLIPELIQKIDYGKGPYYANVGDFGSAGWENIKYFQALPQNIFKIEGGSWNYQRTLLASSTKVGQDNLLGAIELVHTDGPWDVAENFVKFNGYGSYSHGDASQGWSASGLGYHGTWNATNQIPVAAVTSGLIDRFGSLSPTDGGFTDRYLLSGEFHRADDHSATKVMGYAYYYRMGLWNNFDFYLPELPNMPGTNTSYSTQYGDQFQQKDTRWVQGLRASQTYFGQLRGIQMENTFGLDFRNDIIHDILNRTYDRHVFLVVRDDNIVETNLAPYVENKTQWLPWFRSVGGFRFDFMNFNNKNNYTYAANGPQSYDSGSLLRAIPEPKLSLIFGPWAKTEFYLNGGLSYHTDDARGATTHIDPLMGGKTNVFGDQVSPALAVANSQGAEVGVRTAFIPNLQSTLTFWVLRLQSEMIFDGDAGTDEPSPYPDLRKGVEFANYWTPTKWLTIDADICESSARFIGVPKSLGLGSYVPEAARLVISSGIWVRDVNGWSTGLRWRYFGPRYLTQDGSAMSPSTSLLYYNLSYKFNEHWSVSGDIFNLLNAKAQDITYNYQYQLTPTGSPETGNVFHAAEPRTFRLAVTYKF